MVDDKAELTKEEKAALLEFARLMFARAARKRNDKPTVKEKLRGRPKHR